MAGSTGPPLEAGDSGIILPPPVSTTDIVVKVRLHETAHDRADELGAHCPLNRKQRNGSFCFEKTSIAVTIEANDRRRDTK